MQGGEKSVELKDQPVNFFCFGDKEVKRKHETIVVVVVVAIKKGKVCTPCNFISFSLLDTSI
jgi:hypothetical protein